MSHTPGPWWIDQDGDYLCICEGQVNEYGEREEVATLACNRPSLMLCQPANARLIAAAPEMLTALREIADECERRLRKGKDQGDLDTLRVCRTAIAKAEGRE